MRSKLTIKTSEQGQWRRSDVFFVNFEHIKLTIQEFFIVSFKTIVCLDQSFLLNVSKTNYLSTPEPRFRWASQLGCDLPTRDRGYLAVGHGTTDGRWEQPYRGWPILSPGIIRYPFTYLGKIEGWVGLAVRGGGEICCYDFHRESNPDCWHGSTMVYPLCYSCPIS